MLWSAWMHENSPCDHGVRPPRMAEMLIMQEQLSAYIPVGKMRAGYPVRILMYGAEGEI